jgi:hypothetical protein
MHRRHFYTNDTSLRKKPLKILLVHPSPNQLELHQTFKNWTPLSQITLLKLRPFSLIFSSHCMLKLIVQLTTWPDRAALCRHFHWMCFHFHTGFVVKMPLFVSLSLVHRLKSSGLAVIGNHRPVCLAPAFHIQGVESVKLSSWLKKKFNSNVVHIVCTWMRWKRRPRARYKIACVCASIIRDENDLMFSADFVDLLNL